MSRLVVSVFVWLNLDNVLRAEIKIVHENLEVRRSISDFVLSKGMEIFLNGRREYGGNYLTVLQLDTAKMGESAWENEVLPAFLELKRNPILAPGVKAKIVEEEQGYLAWEFSVPPNAVEVFLDLLQEAR